MRIIPRDKFDLEACRNLERASQKEIEKILPHLMEWTQDANWPVFDYIVPALCTLGSKLIPQIRKILNSDDYEWKWIILCFIAPKLDSEVVRLLKDDLLTISNSNDPFSVQNSLPEEAQKILSDLES